MARASKPRRASPNQALHKVQKVPQARTSRPLTAFESRLYKACRCIPKGKVATYGMLAKLLGSAPRAVGQGMRHNQYAPMVPCHRVISTDRRLGGFSGAWGDESPEVIRKRKMLVEEGVLLEGSQVLAKCLVGLPELQQLYEAASDFSAENLGSSAPS